MKRTITYLFILIWPLLTCNSRPDMHIDNTPVKNFELSRYLGTWYEIARYPHSFEKNLVGVTATYSMREDGKIKVVNSGYELTLTGKFKTITGKAKVADDPATGHLKVSFFLFFYGDYRIIELDTADYKYAIVGSRSDKYLWILSRTPVLPKETVDMLLEKIKAKGYSVDKLIWVNQKPLIKFKEGKTI